MLLLRPTSLGLLIHIRRDPLYVAQSTLVARMKRYGSRNVWWSLRPKEYEQLKELDPLEQVVGQVCYSRKRIEECLARVPAERKLSIDYESLCAHVPAQLLRISEWLAVKGMDVGAGDTLPAEFPCSNTVKIEMDEFDVVAQTVARYFG